MKGRIMKIMKKSSAGFTMIEVIVSLVLMSIVGIVAAMGLVQGIKAYAITRTSSETVQRAEYALNRIKLEFINMDTVTAASSESITFTTDKVIGRATGTLYTIARSGNQINLTVTPTAGTASTNALLTGVGTGGTFLTYTNNAGGGWVYTDGFGSTSTCPATFHCCSSSLHSITINLIIPRSDGGGNITFTTSINPRNNECTNGPESSQ
jgi:prepilin-type N-terminal cleavage/methylation domain-containing protein